MAGGTIVRNAGASRRVVIAIVTTKTPGGVVMADVVGVRPPSYVHRWENICAIDGHEEPW